MSGGEHTCPEVVYLVHISGIVCIVVEGAKYNLVRRYMLQLRSVIRNIAPKPRFQLTRNKDNGRT